MITERLIQAINNGIHEHYGVAPKFIAMNRKNYEIMKDESNTIGIEKGIFFGIPIRITETEKEFELKFYVDPLNKETK